MIYWPVNLVPIDRQKRPPNSLIRQFGSQEKHFNVEGSDAKLPESQEGGWKQRESLILAKFGGGGGGGRSGGGGGEEEEMVEEEGIHPRKMDLSAKGIILPVIHLSIHLLIHAYGRVEERKKEDRKGKSPVWWR